MLKFTFMPTITFALTLADCMQYTPVKPSPVCCSQTVVQGKPGSSSGYVKLAFKLSAGGPAVGIAFALCLAAWLRFAGGNLSADVSMTLVASYGSFHVAGSIFMCHMHVYPVHLARVSYVFCKCTMVCSLRHAWVTPEGKPPAASLFFCFNITHACMHRVPITSWLKSPCPRHDLMHPETKN